MLTLNESLLCMHAGITEFIRKHPVSTSAVRAMSLEARFLGPRRCR
jgi:hypothetical protein